MSEPLDALWRGLAAVGLRVALPIPAAVFDSAAAPVRLSDLLSGARTAVIIGDGGPGFFRGFLAAGGPDGAPHPLDRYTRTTLAAVARGALAPLGLPHALVFPFSGGGVAGPPLPFQRLGRAAGMGPPGPLGIQVHPVYGPWWAYRGLIALDVAAEAVALPAAAPRSGDGCAGCDAPCVAACPAGAVRTAGLHYLACASERLAPASACRTSCAARIRCVRGPEHRYSDAQLEFHMTASFPRTGLAVVRP